MPSHRSTHKLLFSLLALLLCLPLTGWKGPDPQKQYWYGKLGIDFRGSRSQMYACIGDSFQLGFTVKNIVDEFGRPVSEAMVEVTDGRGNVRAQVTNQAGWVGIQWPIKEEGMLKLTVNAHKEWYDPAKPLVISLRGVECSWLLKIDFLEEYYVEKEFGLAVGATTTWRGELGVEPGRGETLDGRIVLKGSSGQYEFYTVDTLVPYNFALDPQISGDWNLRVEGTSSNNQITLDLHTEPVSYPQILNFIVTTVDPNINVLYAPPTPTSNGNGLFLDFNHLARLTFPTSGGSVRLDSGMSCYFFTNERSRYSLAITLSTLHGVRY